MTKTAQLMADAKFYESYARYDDDLERYETWDEAVQRVMDMHHEYYADKMSPELEEYLNFAQNAYSDKSILGAQRALQFGGEQLLKNHAKLYNCTATYVDRSAFFGEAFYLMLSGCFHPNTLVKTKEGDKKISELTTKDLVKTYDVQNKKFLYKNPLQVVQNQTNKTPKIQLTLENGEVILLTANHEVLTKRGYVEAKDLLDTDEIIMDSENDEK